MKLPALNLSFYVLVVAILLTFNSEVTFAKNSISGPSFTEAHPSSTLVLTTSDNNVVRLPTYIRCISQTIQESDTHCPLSVSCSKETLHLLRQIVDVLPESARNTKGKKVPIHRIGEDTLFPNPLVQSQLKYQLNSNEGTTNEQLDELYAVVNELQIKCLIHAVASCIIDRVYPLNGIELETALKDNQFHKSILENTDHLYKYLHLKQHGNDELTIADYIALHGQPMKKPILFPFQKGLYNPNFYPFTWDILDLRDKKLTGLQGIELIKNPEDTYALYLDHNHILSRDIDPDFPQDPLKGFAQLDEIRLDTTVQLEWTQCQEVDRIKLGLNDHSLESHTSSLPLNKATHLEINNTGEYPIHYSLSSRIIVRTSFGPDAWRYTEGKILDGTIHPGTTRIFRRILFYNKDYSLKLAVPNFPKKRCTGTAILRIEPRPR